MLCIIQSQNMFSVINGLYKKMLLILLRAMKQRKISCGELHPNFSLILHSWAGCLQGS